MSGEPQPGVVQWVTQAQPDIAKAVHWQPPYDARAKCFEILAEVAHGALEHAYEALGALQDCCQGEDSGFYQNALWRLGELIDEVDERLS